MIESIVYSKRYVRIMWKRTPFRMANMAHCYPCCDVPTDYSCRMCTESFPCLLRRKPVDRGIIIGSGRRHSVHDFFITQLAAMAMVESNAMHYHLKNDLMRPVRRLFKERKYQQCSLPGCQNQTNHRGGYCCSDHSRKHKIMTGKKVKAIGR